MENYDVSAIASILRRRVEIRNAKFEELTCGHQSVKCQGTPQSEGSHAAANQVIEIQHRREITDYTLYKQRRGHRETAKGARPTQGVVRKLRYDRGVALRAFQ